MRPPILQWKVFLGLLAVVIAAASLGSALHPTSQTTPKDTLYFGPYTGLAQRILMALGGGTQAGGWTGYQPLHARIQPGVVFFPNARRKNLGCATFFADGSFRGFCRTHR